MKLNVSTSKTRNPMVAPAHFRRAGMHQPRSGSLRQRCARALRRELEQLIRPKPHP